MTIFSFPSPLLLSSFSSPPPSFAPCLSRQYPAVLQFSVFLLAYLLLLVLALAEEFKQAPWVLQQLCCWIHENNNARNLLTLSAITLNFAMVSTDMVRGDLGRVIIIPKPIRANNIKTRRSFFSFFNPAMT